MISSTSASAGAREPTTSPPHPPDLWSDADSLPRLEQHARSIAATHVVQTQVQGDFDLAIRFQHNLRWLKSTFQELDRLARESAAAAPADLEAPALPPAAKWLLGNSQIIEEQLRGVQEHLPRDYYIELPKLEGGVPRVYALVVELLAHTDNALDEELILRFVQAYQEVAPLSVGEVWAVPIMLRVRLIETLRTLTAALPDRRSQPDDAAPQQLASRQQQAPRQQQEPRQQPTSSPTHESSSPERSAPLQNDAFSSEIPPLPLCRHEILHQATLQVSLSNVLTSMRLMTVLDWTVFFERSSHVEAILRQDPAGIYGAMDFETRDQYRHAVEELAKGSGLSDLTVARRALALAEMARGDLPESKAAHSCRTHVGYYLIDAGREQLEAKIAYRPRLLERLTRLVLRTPTLFYLGGIGLLTAAGVGGMVLLAASQTASWWLRGLAGLLALVPASELATEILNFLVTTWRPPYKLPRLELKEGGTRDYPTMVVVPSMLLHETEVHNLLQRLELHFLANPEPELYFSLLTDFSDAPAEHMPTDQKFLDLAIEGIRRLNTRYPRTNAGSSAPAVADRFFLFHRRRTWNSRDGVWMGWERKRGKLLEFNRWLLRTDPTTFLAQEGDWSGLPTICYVITLDADTQMPHGAARRLIGVMAHPLNRPRETEFAGQPARATAGYTMLQPRVGLDLPSAHRSRFARLFSNGAGLDPYVTAVSDVYQDLFHEGNFVGKGIYDVTAFQAAVAESFPENAILSHDLIEGCHARVGLVTDVELIDGFPARYEAFTRRQHRWVRGDWQLLPWLLPRVPTAHGVRINPLSGISRWKILDNMRRSLVPVALVVLLLAGWLVLPGSAWTWTLAAWLVPLFPVLIRCGSVFHNLPRDLRWHEELQLAASHLRHQLPRTLAQAALAITFLAHNAAVNLDAVVRSLYRMLVSRRKLLEWETAAATEKRLDDNRWSCLSEMWMASVLSVAVLLMLILTGTSSGTLAAAIPLLLVWFGSPLLAYWISLPTLPAEPPLTDKQRQSLRQLARRTWSYFETFVGPEDHWLPPDNVQERPARKDGQETRPVIARRVSPTNEGMFLVSTLVARDLGYVGAHRLAELLESNLTSWEKLERSRQHFYNWYDTVSLQPLQPRYISTVDSGNLAASLLTLAQGLRGESRRCWIDERQATGIEDSITLVEEALAHAPQGTSQETQVLCDTLQYALRSLRQCLQSGPRPQERDYLLQFFWPVVGRGTQFLDVLRQLEARHPQDSECAASRRDAHSGNTPAMSPAAMEHRLLKTLSGLEERILGREEIAVHGDRYPEPSPPGSNGDHKPRRRECPGFGGDELAAKLQGLVQVMEGHRQDVERCLPWLDVIARQCQPSLPAHSVTQNELRRESRPSDGIRWHAPSLNWPMLSESAAWQLLWDLLREAKTLETLAELEAMVAAPLQALRETVSRSQMSETQKQECGNWLDELADAFHTGSQNASHLRTRLMHLAERCELIVRDMNFGFLFDRRRQLFHIGYNIETQQLDRGHYDLLASEARLTSYLAIIRGDADDHHWFRLGRNSTCIAGQLCLLSWGGSLFEYLMPTLFTRIYPGSLLEQACRTAIDRQMNYARQKQVPWGMSESALAVVNDLLDYCYQPFGIPGLGLRRDRGQDVVVSPYSTLLSLGVEPHQAELNLRELIRAGALGAWGFYDAIDYTPARSPHHQHFSIVPCYMTHHQGMSLLALANHLLDGCVQNRFHSHPAVQAAELLLQERIPESVSLILSASEPLLPSEPDSAPHPHHHSPDPSLGKSNGFAGVHGNGKPHVNGTARTISRDPSFGHGTTGFVSRRISTPATSTPRTHLLSNGDYTVLLTNAGGGVSRWRDMTVSRPTSAGEEGGQVVYLKDLRRGQVWSAGFHPTRCVPDSYEVIYSVDKATYRRRDGDLETQLEIAVSPGHNAELRRLSLTNHSLQDTEIEVTSFTELALAAPGDDPAPPQFSHQFVQTEFLSGSAALLAMRPPRDSQQSPRWAVHVLACDTSPRRLDPDHVTQPRQQSLAPHPAQPSFVECEPGMLQAPSRLPLCIEFETSRGLFVGRDRAMDSPTALDSQSALTGTTGGMAEPVFSLRTRVHVAAGETVTLALVTAVAHSRDEALQLATHYHDLRMVRRDFELAWIYAQDELRRLHLTARDAHLYQRLASSLIYPEHTRQARLQTVLSSRHNRSVLWRYGISGERPVVFIPLSRPEQTSFIRDCLVMREYWRTHGLETDLVVLNDSTSPHADALQDSLEALLRPAPQQHSPNTATPWSPWCHLVRGTQVSRDDLALLESVAATVLDPARGPLSLQLAEPASAAESVCLPVLNGRSRSDIRPSLTEEAAL